jgi:hypothetical protein
MIAVEIAMALDHAIVLARTWFVPRHTNPQRLTGRSRFH